MNKQVLEFIKQVATKYGGITLNHNGKVAKLNSGFSVSKKQYEKVYNSIESLDLETLNNYLLLARKINKTNKTYKVWVGLWIDSGKLYLDISMNIENKGIAIQVARQEKQLAIFDNFNKVCISTK